jgi:hypothetical protein
MINEQLQNYIQESVRAGGSREDIKKSLIAAGWQEADIEEAFRTLEPQVVVPVLVGQPIEPKAHKKFGWIIAVIAIIVVLGIGAYLFFARPWATAKQQTPPPSTGANTLPQSSQTPPVPVAATCTDSNAAQGVNAIYTKGTVTSVDSVGHTQTFTDDCANMTYLVEYVCYESPVGSGHYTDGRTLVSCPHGCANGTCKK